MKKLNIFVDESGDLGEYDHRAPYYIISLVLHDQNYDMNRELAILEESLANIGWSKHCLHAGPVIRSEEEYKGAKSMLTAAALTYVAAMIVALANLLRLILLANRRSR